MPADASFVPNAYRAAVSDDVSSATAPDRRDNGTPPAQERRKRRLWTQLWFWVLVAIAAGIVLGLVAPSIAKETKWLADAFIQLIKTVTGPVIFVTVVVGIASLGNMAKAGGLAARALGYFLIATIVALALGLLAGNLVQPGAGFEGAPSDSARASAQAQVDAGQQESGLVPFLTHELLPTSFVAPFVDNKILQILVLAILTAASISALAPRLRERIVSVIDVISKIIFGIIRLIMWAAPLGAFGGMAYTVAVFGASSLENLALLMVTFWVTCAIFVFVILGSVAAWSGFNIFKLVRLIKDELLIIVGTSSSETVLPRLLAKLRVRGRVPPDRRRGHPDRLLVQPGRHLHLPHARGAVHRAGRRPDPAARRPDRALRADGAHVQGRRRDHGCRARDAGRLPAGVRR